MSPLFGKSDEKAAQDEAAKAEVARLTALWYSATRLGETAFADGTAEQQIQAHG